ncbi:MAG: DUF4126 domain-containing protein, partial [Thermodesulfobacteriota bacterium]
VIANNADATNIYFIQVRGVAGGWIAGLVQGTTTALRAKSSVSTAGIANVLVSTQSLRKT